MWKKAQDRKPLLLLGARQVGKTYILKEFGKNEFSNMVYINCHTDSFAANLFEDFDIQRIVYQIGIHTRQKVIPGQTLLFFDEMQEVAQGFPSLKYFCENLRCNRQILFRHFSEKLNRHIKEIYQRLDITVDYHLFL